MENLSIEEEKKLIGAGLIFLEDALLSFNGVTSPKAKILLGILHAALEVAEHFFPKPTDEKPTDEDLKF